MRGPAGAAVGSSLAAMGVGAMLLLGGRPAVGLALVAVAFALAPVALALVATGRGNVSRVTLLLLAILCAIGALLGAATAFGGPTERYVIRGIGALVAALSAWGVMLAVRVLRPG